MASFTENNIPQFNPYIQQQPLEQMVTVGVEKQRRYDEGLQKIQTNIDNIAGLDVYNDADKKYLQSKLNELGSKLRTVAAGDFSNYQLTNSVGGMVKQLGKDPLIQEAVKSTAQFRKDLQRLQEDKNAGKALDENTDDFFIKASGWIQASKPGEPYTGRYMTPINVWDKLTSIADKIGVETKELQQLFKTDSSGKVLYNYDKNGNPTTPQWNPVMAEKVLKGKDPAKVLSAFQNALTTADYEQLAITGRYNNKNKTPEMLKESIIAQTSSQLKSVTDRLDSFKVALYNEESKNDKDLESINSLKKSVEYFESLQSKLLESRNKGISLVGTNPDAVRASLYTDSYLTTMAMNLSGQSESVKYSVNPMFTITMEQNKFNRQIQRDKVEDYKWTQEQNRKDIEFAYTKTKDALDFYEKTGIKLPGLPDLPTADGNLLTEPFTTEDISGGTIKAAVESDYQNKVATLNDTNYKLTLQYIKNINRSKQIPGESEEAYTKRMQQAISEFASGNKENINPQSGEINSFTSRFASKLLASAKVNKNAIPVEFRSLVSAQNDLISDLSLQKAQMEQVTQEAIAEGTARGLLLPKASDIAKNVKPITIRDANGKPLTLSSSDVVDIINTNKDYFSTIRGVFSSKEDKLNSEKALERLKLKYGEKGLNNIVNQLMPIQTDLGSSLFRNKQLDKSAEWLFKSNYNSLRKIESEIYLQKGLVKQPVSTAITRGEGKDREAMNTRISSVVDSYRNLNEIPGFSEADFQAALLSTDPAALKIVSEPGVSSSSPTKHTLIMTTPDNKKIPIRINDEQYTYITRTAPPTNLSIPKVVQRINYFGTSNLAGSNDPVSAYWGDDKFTRFESPKYTITGDLIPDQVNPNNLWFNMYLFPKDGKSGPEKITFPDPMNKYNKDGSINQSLDNLPQAINATIINQLTKQK